MQENNNIRINFPIDYRWFPAVLTALQLYMKENGFGEQLMQMVCMAVDQTLGRLYLFALASKEKTGESSSAELSFVFKDGKLSIYIVYDNHLHFDPLADSSVDDARRNAEALNVEGASPFNDWLVTVKSQMDRADFRTDGNRQTIHMEKYLREQGKEKQLWIFTLKPCLKQDVYVDDSEIEGSNYAGYVHNFKTDKVLRLGRTELDIVKRLDGKTSLFDIYIDFAVNSSEGPVSPQVFAILYEQLERSGMFVEGHKKKKAGFAHRVWSAIYNLTFVLPKSDFLAGVFYRMFRPLFTRVGVVCILLFALSALYPIFTQFDEFRHMFSQSFSVLKSDKLLVLVLSVLGFLSMVLHEFSHAAVVKKYGGHVPRIGITYYIFTFIFFCDTTGSGNFPRKMQRIMVSLGGPLCSLLIWATAVWTLALTDNLQVKTVAFMMYFSLGFSIVLNFNPLLRMDSYYMLSDIVGIDGLRSRSFAFIKNRIKKMFGVRVHEPFYPPRQKMCLVVYGMLGLVVTSYFCVRPFVRIMHFTSHGFTLSAKVMWMLILSLIGIVNVGNLILRNVRGLTHRQYKIK